MGITAEAPRGGVVEQIGDATYTLLLRNQEIERFEDRHRGIFELWLHTSTHGLKDLY